MNRVSLYLENRIVGRSQEKLAKIANQEALRARMVRLGVVVSFLFFGVFLASPGAANAVTKTSASSGNWNGANNWSPNGVPGSGDDVIIAAGHTIDYNNNTSTVLSITINSTGTLRINDNAVDFLTVTGSLTNNGSILAGGPGNRVHTLSVGGSFINNNIFTATSANGDVINVIFNGGSAQTLSGTTATTFSGLTINNSAGLTLSNSITVNAVLGLTNGDITTGSNTLNMGSAATSTGTTDVVGRVMRTHTFTTATAYAFGNPFVTLNFSGAGTKPTAMLVVLSKGSAPGNFTNAVSRYYAITNTGGSAFSATVQLRYLDAELNGNTEASLQLWRESGTTWSAQGFTARDTTNNFVSLTGVTTFSRWTLSSGSAPTDVTFLSMKATQYEGRVLLEWQTGYEVGNVGFNVYREEKDGMVKVTPEPVAGSALMFGPNVTMRAGFAYSWWDKNAQSDENTRYWIEDLDISGRTAIHGPFFVSETGMKGTTSSSKLASPLLSEISKDASALGFSAPVERFAKPVKTTTANIAIQAAIASQQAVKLSIKQEGWYRVTQSALAGAGFPSNSNPAKLQLFVDGLEVPIKVTGGASWDGIEFYGTGINSPFTSNHVYWLVAGNQNGLRIPQVGAQSGSPAPPSFSFAVERRDKVVYFPSLKNGGGEKFFGPLIYNALFIDQSVNLPHIASSPTLATLDVSLQGFTDVPHNVRVFLNGSELGTVQFNGLVKGTAQYSVPQSTLLEGNNQIQFLAPAGFSDITMVEYVRVSYQHSNTADGNSIRFPISAGLQTSIGGFTGSAIRVVDATDPNSPQELTPTVSTDGTSFTAMVTAPGAGTRTLLAFASDQQKAPSALTANQPSSWATRGVALDYVAVTRQELIGSIQPLLTSRKNQGLKTAVINIEDVYDEFSFGNKTPQALKDFFSYALTTWKKAPRFAVLVGDASVDPKNYIGLGDFDLVPTKLVETALTETATDDWFVDVASDGVPDIAIGRLPVRTPAEASALASKIVGYDSYEGSTRVLLVADRNNGYDFEAADTQLQSLIPASITLTDIRRGQVGDSEARSQLLDALNSGPKLVNFYGHGSTRLWTDAPILSSTDAASLDNTERLTLFDSMTCLTGYFQDPSIESLGEALLKSAGGAIAVWASSGMTEPSAQVEMNQRAIQLLFAGSGLTVGEITAQAKAATNNPDVRRTWVLLGDPATRIK
jgi:hypothetical protein